MSKIPSRKFSTTKRKIASTKLGRAGRHIRSNTKADSTNVKIPSRKFANVKYVAKQNRKRMRCLISLAEIGGTANKIDEMLANDPKLLSKWLGKNKTPAQWAEKGRTRAQNQVYLGGKLQVVTGAKGVVVPGVPDNYAENAGRTARICAALAAKRLTPMVQMMVRDS